MVKSKPKQKIPKGPRMPIFTGDQGYPSYTSLRPSTTHAAGFGDTIQDVDREFAAVREPIGHFITVFVGSDIFTNWFTLNDLNTQSPDEQLDNDAQKVLKQIGAQQAFTAGAIWERIHGESYLVLALDDAQSERDLTRAVSSSAEIFSITAYPRTKVRISSQITDVNSPAYGQVSIYELDRGNKKTLIHASRVIKLRTSHDGSSVLDPIWDDLTCLRNIRWGMAQTMYRYGSGFPVISAKGATYDQLKTMSEDERITNLMSRTYFLKNESIDFEFKGAQGAALNPLPYYTPLIENISAGCKIPAAILRGVQAGALTGSEVNEREYAMLIKSFQKLYEEPLRLVLDRILLSLEKQIDYEINWKSVVHLSDTALADLDLRVEQTNEKRLLYMTVDEVREKMGMEAIGGEEGSTIPGLVKPAGFGGSSSPAPVSRLKTALTDSTDHAHDQGRPFEHPQMVSDLKQIIYRARRKEVTKVIALEEARKVIDHYMTDEIARAKAYLAARTGRPMPLLPPEKTAHYDRKRAEYMTDFNLILEDTIAKSRD